MRLGLPPRRHRLDGPVSAPRVVLPGQTRTPRRIGSVERVVARLEVPDAGQGHVVRHRDRCRRPRPQLRTLGPPQRRDLARVDLRSGERLGPGLPETTPVFWSAVLLTQGSELAYDVAEGIAIWDLDPEHQYRAACRIAGRELTTDEWTAYLSGLGTRRATCADVLGS